MGWWRSRRNPQDVLGDGPADALHLELERLASASDGKPTFQTLLNGLAAALGDDAPALTADPDSYRGQPVVARFDPPATTLHSTSAPESPRVLLALAAALKAITAAYELELSRKPTLSEAFETIVFILRPHPEQYLSNTEGRRLAELSTDAGPP
jgi:hypothetical protein